MQPTTKSKLFSTGLAALLFVLPFGASAVPFSFTETANLVIPSAGSGGTDEPASFTNSTLSVAESNVINSMTVTLALSHTWIGDLLITLESPAGTIITLMDRPGTLNTGLGSPFGSPDNFSVDFPVTFDDASPNDPEDMGPGVTTGSPDTYFVHAGALSDFAGENTQGDWLLSIHDKAGGDTGLLSSWSIQGNRISVPEPSSVLLVAIGLLVVSARQIARARASD